MPRNSSGTYTLPIGAFSPGGLIKSSDHNSNYSDISTALTQSVASTGVTPITGPLLGASGSVTAPSFTFNSAQKTGFYLPATNQIGWAANGVQGATFNSDTSVTWAGNQSIGGTLGVTGASTFTSATFSGSATLSGGLVLGSAMSVSGGSFGSSTVFGASGGSHSIGTVPDPGGSAGSTRFLREDSSWQAVSFSLPTVQRLTVGSGNYTPTAGTTKARVMMCGPGGGGGAQSTNSGSNGAAASSFGSWTANPGNGGGVGGGVGGTGGTGGTNGTGNLIKRITGGQGQSGTTNSSGVVGPHGGQGGNGPLGGAGAGAGSGQTGLNAAANTGAGGGGAGANGGSSSAGGGAGEYVEFWVNSPGVTAYVVGAKGNGGTAGTTAGGNGADGSIVIEEYYF